MKPRDRIQVWIGGRSHNVHAVQIHGDTITAVPLWKPPACDSCRVSFVLAEVDSVRRQDMPAEFFFVTGVAFVAGIIAWYVGGLKSNY